MGHIYGQFLAFFFFLAMFGPILAIILAMGGHIWPWEAIYGHGRPFMAMGGHMWTWEHARLFQRWPALAGFAPVLSQKFKWSDLTPPTRAGGQDDGS